MLGAGGDTSCEIGAMLNHARAALFILATLLLILSGILLLIYPPVLHSIPLHLDGQRIRQLSVSGSPTHRLEIDRDGRMALGGRPLCDLIDLRQELDLIANERESIFEVLPDPELRYDRFVEIMGVVARANIQNLKVDSQPSLGRRAARKPSLECRERILL